MLFRCLLCVFILALTASPVLGEERLREALQAALEARYEETGVPGGAILVQRGDDAAIELVAGVRNAKTKTPVEPGDLWHIGS